MPSAPKLEDMMKLWEEGLSDEERALLDAASQDDLSPRRR